MCAERFILVSLLSGALFAASARADAPVSFRNDVMAVLSKAGCNAGACHGNKSGKGGFKLSLRGESFSDDYVALTRDLAGRRVNVLEPDQSLMLLKPTTQLPHEGGKRFDKDSPEHAIVKRWRAERYHAPTDDLEQPIDRQSAADFNRLYLDLVKAVADRGTRPQWNNDSFFKRFAKQAAVP